MENGRIKVIDASLQKTAQGDSLAGSSNPLDAISTRLLDLEGQASLARAAMGADEATAAVGLSVASPTNRSSSGPFRRVQGASTSPPTRYTKLFRTAQAKDVAALESTKAGYTDKFPGLEGP